MTDTPEQILIKQAALARYQRQQLINQQHSQEQNRTSFSATLVRYDAASGLWLCRLLDESLVYGRSISPSGSKGIGDVVTLTKNGAGMPVIRWL